MRTDNEIQTYTEPTPPCTHGPKCPLCWYNSLGPKIDVDLGPDV
jgi:hypothetical protein